MSYRIIVSPAKKMNVVDDEPHPRTQPVFLAQTIRLMHEVQRLSYEECRELWKCSDKLARPNYQRFQAMDLTQASSAAVCAYEGIQYQHLCAQVMSAGQLAWLQDHLRILSGFYGVLRPLDGVVPYRLEMQAKLSVGGAKDLYEFWGTSLYDALAAEADTIVNVASVEYARAVTRHAMEGGPRMVTCLFGEPRGELGLVQKSTEAKAARGTFVRWCAENAVEDPYDFRDFAERGYRYDPARSQDATRRQQPAGRRQAAGSHGAGNEVMVFCLQES